MNPSDDHVLPRRPLLFPVVIAVILLAVIGASAGLVLGARHRRNAGQPTTLVQPPPTQQPIETAAQPEWTQSPTPASTSPTPNSPSNGVLCRPETYAAAGTLAHGRLTRALLLRTEKSSVWICRDDDGRLFYHANRGGPDAPWKENETALFLPDVRRDGKGGYTVLAADGTRITVTSQALDILHKDGTAEHQRAIG